MASGYEATTDQLFSVVQSAMSNASLLAGRITGNGRPSLRERSLRHEVGDIALQKPPQFSDLFAGGDPSNAIIGQLNSQVDQWLGKYFPLINSSFKSIPEEWLVNVISGVKPFGIEKTVFDLVWHQARDRAYRSVRAEQRSLEAAFSGRGFTMPLGALVDALAQSEQRATDAVLDVSRDQAIKDADIKVDILKHATALAAQMKAGILNTSADFFRNFYSVHTQGNETARIRAQAYGTYYNALSNFYNVELGLEQLRLRAAEASSEISLGIDRNRVAAYSDSSASGAHAQAARGFADIASSSASAAGTLTAQIEAV